MKKTWIFLALCVLVSYSSVFAQGLRLSLIGAVSKEVGPSHENFNWGFSVGGNVFFFLGDNLLLGVRSTYTRFTPDESEFTQSVSDLFNGNVSGNAFIVEILPTLRLTTRYPMSGVNLFGQVGAGIYILNTEITVSGDDGGGSTVEQIFGEGTIGRFGFNVGAGITFGNPEFISVDLYPIFNMIFLGDDTFRYFSINLALGLGI
ncbi:MAG TPA: hypothetical protein VHP36_04260 [Chitinispirillaceae bacterium]|nr:hypothetical protein [Chitinispirillaceae bacterium]